MVVTLATAWWAVRFARVWLYPVQALVFDETDADVISYSWSTYRPEYLEQLRAEFGLEALVEECATDYQKVRTIASWVHSRWKHDGSNQPAQSDPIYILREAAKGQRFRCVEYGIVVSGCLQALGIQARTLALKTQDCETRATGAGHVVTEAYLADLGKWIFIDGQADAIPELDGVPLNAVEFQQAIARKAPGLTVSGMSSTAAAAYQKYVSQYLYYFDVSAQGKIIMLGPLGAEQPTVFQRKYPITVTEYIHSVRAFYAPPR